jgi:predicted DNA-binding transcriptional regulator AlpA
MKNPEKAGRAVAAATPGEFGSQPLESQIHHSESPGGRLLVNGATARRILSIGERQLWTLTNCRAIPSRRIGRSVRYVPAELAAWVAAGCPTDAGAGERIRAGMGGAA